MPTDPGPREHIDAMRKEEYPFGESAGKGWANFIDDTNPSKPQDEVLKQALTERSYPFREIFSEEFKNSIGAFALPFLALRRLKHEKEYGLGKNAGKAWADFIDRKNPPQPQSEVLEQALATKDHPFRETFPKEFQHSGDADNLMRLALDRLNDEKSILEAWRNKEKNPKEELAEFIASKYQGEGMTAPNSGWPILDRDGSLYYEEKLEPGQKPREGLNRVRANGEQIFVKKITSPGEPDFERALVLMTKMMLQDPQTRDVLLEEIVSENSRNNDSSGRSSPSSERSRHSRQSLGTDGRARLPQPHDEVLIGNESFTVIPISVSMLRSAIKKMNQPHIEAEQGIARSSDREDRQQAAGNSRESLAEARAQKQVATEANNPVRIPPSNAEIVTGDHFPMILNVRNPTMQGDLSRMIQEKYQEENAAFPNGHKVEIIRDTMGGALYAGTNFFDQQETQPTDLVIKLVPPGDDASPQPLGQIRENDSSYGSYRSQSTARPGISSRHAQASLRGPESNDKYYVVKKIVSPNDRGWDQLRLNMLYAQARDGRGR